MLKHCYLNRIESDMYVKTNIETHTFTHLLHRMIFHLKLMLPMIVLRWKVPS
jgi:hypothetical protein